MKRYFTLALAVLAVAACQRPENPVVRPDVEPGKVEIEGYRGKLRERRPDRSYHDQGERYREFHNQRMPHF